MVKVTELEGKLAEVDSKLMNHAAWNDQVLGFTDETGGKNYVKMADVVHRLEAVEDSVRQSR